MSTYEAELEIDPSAWGIYSEPSSWLHCKNSVGLRLQLGAAEHKLLCSYPLGTTELSLQTRIQVS